MKLVCVPHPTRIDQAGEAVQAVDMAAIDIRLEDVMMIDDKQEVLEEVDRQGKKELTYMLVW